MFWLIVIVVFVLAVLILLALMTGDAAHYNQAQAVIETAKVAQKASDNLAVAQFQNTLLLVLVVILILVAVGAVVFALVTMAQANRKPQSKAEKGDWISGPNANWGRRNELPAGYQSGYPQIPPGYMLVPSLPAPNYQQQLPAGELRYAPREAYAAQIPADEYRFLP